MSGGIDGYASVSEELGLPEPRCEGCGRLIGETEAVYRRCRMGYCQIISCECGHEVGSIGPAGCPECSPWRSPRLRAIRQAYRHRRRRR